MSQSNAILITAGIIVGLIAFAAIVALISMKVMGAVGRKRSAALKKSAALSGFAFTEKPDGSLISGLKPVFDLFNKGDRQHEFRNYMEGEIDGHHAAIFDYGYTNYYHNTSQNINHTVCLLDMKAPLPSFRLKSKGLLEKVRDVGGFPDIDPGNDPEFSKHCWLKGLDEAAVKEVFGPGTAMYFRDGEALHNVVIEADGQRLMYYHIGHVQPEGMNDFLFKAGEVSHLTFRTSPTHFLTIFPPA